MAGFDTLARSEPVLTRIVTELLKDSPSAAFQLSLLAECGRTFHQAAVNAIFHTLIVPDDDSQFGSIESGPISAVLRNSKKYAPCVRTLIVVGPLSPIEGENTLFELEDSDSEPVGIRPISGSQVQRLLGLCSALEELAWISSVPPPDGIGEMLSTHTSLDRFTFAPPPCLALPLPKWDACSLSSLPPLSYLHLTRLSQMGASALASHPPDVHHLALDFIWLDDWVCERLSRIPRLKRLRISTGGTKLTDRGIGALLGGLDSLNILELVEVQGRLSKSLWENVELPMSLHTLKIALSESGPHYSWTADHLMSLPSLSGLDQLRRISITRTCVGGQIDDVAVAKTVPSEMVDALKGCTRLEQLECDWWAWTIEDLKELVQGCVNLETLRITLDAPFARLLTLTSSFAQLGRLTKLYVTVPSLHAPSTPPSPTLPTPGMSPLGMVGRVNGIVIGSPTSSPISLARSLKSPKLVTPVPLPEELGTSLTTSPVTPGGVGNTNGTIDATSVDAVLPPLRDVRRFMRRCPRLVLLEWFGRTARGAWIAHREDAKSVAGVKVEFVPPGGEEDMTGMTGYCPLLERLEAKWMGPEAEAAANSVREYEAERDGEIEREKEARRRRPSVNKAPMRQRGATVSGISEINPGGNRRRQCSASEGLGKAKVPVSPGSKRSRRSP